MDAIDRYMPCRGLWAKKGAGSPGAAIRPLYVAVRFALQQQRAEVLIRRAHEQRSQLVGVGHG